MATNWVVRPSTSTRSPLATTTGRAAVRHGPSLWSTALIGATTISGPAPPPVPGSAGPANRQSRRNRWPIVETSGLTRSKGRVSQAGNTSTADGLPSVPAPPVPAPSVPALPVPVPSSDPGPPMKASRSWASCSAAAPVGVTMSTGRRLPSRTIPANTKAWAGVATASVAVGAPTTRVMAGSSRSKGGSERRLTRSGYRAPSDDLSGRAGCPVGADRQAEALNRFMAASTPSDTIASTASAASLMASTSNARSEAPGRFRT